MSNNTATNIIGSSSIKNRTRETASPSGPFKAITTSDGLTSANESPESNYLNGIDSIDNIFNPFQSTSSFINSLSTSFSQQKIMESHSQEEGPMSNNLMKSLTNLNMLNSSFSNNLLEGKTNINNSNNHSNNMRSSNNTPQPSNLLHQTCGICGKYPMVNGKTLVGCLHSFCQPCLIQSSLSNSLLSTSSIIACPICSQETLIPNGGIDALMPHYSNPILLSLNQDLNQNNSYNNFINLSSSYQTSSTTSTTASSPVSNSNFVKNNASNNNNNNNKFISHSNNGFNGNNNNNNNRLISNKNSFHPVNQDLGTQPNLKTHNYSIHKQQQIVSNSSKSHNNSQNAQNSNNSLNHSNDLINSNDLIDSSNNYESLVKKQLLQQQQKVQQQQQNRLFQIENEIQKTYAFYIHNLNERRDFLLKEFHAIVQFVISQNQKNKSNSPKQQNQQQQQRQLSHSFSNKSESFDSQGDNEYNLENDQVETMKNNDLQAMINNYLMSIEFVTSFPSIQTSIYNTFGYIRYNSNPANNNDPSSFNGNMNQNGTQVNNQNQPGLNALYKPKPIGPSSGSPPSYNNNDSNNNGARSIYSNGCGHPLLNSHGNTEFLIEQFVNNISNGHNNLVGSTNINDKDKSPLHSFVNNHLNGSSDTYNNNSFSQFGDNSNSSKFQKNHNSSNNSNNLKTGSSNAPTAATSWSSVVAASANRSNSTSNQNNSDSNLVLATEENMPRLSSTSNMSNNSNLNSLISPQSTILSSSSSSSSSASSSTCNEHQVDANTAEEANNMLSNSLCSSVSVPPNKLNINNLSSSVGSGVVSSPNSANPLLPARSQLKRSKMIYNCKFGEFGVTDGQFTEPSGVAINSNNEIIVADTNSHRIQIFDREGRFKFKFGECGKREGQLLYPNRVAVVKHTGDIVVTERSPTHQIQIYNQFGQFLRKFGANILQHPRGVCVDSKGRIIVVECKVMRVLIFDLMGNVLQKFNCSKYLEFPNGCCCSNDREEIFISDNRAHCIKVFNYEGQYMRQIGGEGITNYPIGVGINTNGEVLVADNHNNFNLTVFTQDGQVINALESKVKHAQCFDVGLMDDGSIVLASKDYRIYVYRYSSNGITDGTNTQNLIQVASSGNNNNNNNQQVNNFSSNQNAISIANNKGSGSSLISSLTDFSF